MYASEAGKLSQETSVIMATIVEFEHRMLTKRPTVARTSEAPNWIAAKRPTVGIGPRPTLPHPHRTAAGNSESLTHQTRRQARATIQSPREIALPPVEPTKSWP